MYIPTFSFILVCSLYTQIILKCILYTNIYIGASLMMYNIFTSYMVQLVLKFYGFTRRLYIEGFSS
jgi:hypothetical protein